MGFPIEISQCPRQTKRLNRASIARLRFAAEILKCIKFIQNKNELLQNILKKKHCVAKYSQMRRIIRRACVFCAGASMTCMPYHSDVKANPVFFAAHRRGTDYRRDAPEFKAALLPANSREFQFAGVFEVRKHGHFIRRETDVQKKRRTADDGITASFGVRRIPCALWRSRCRAGCLAESKS